MCQTKTILELASDLKKLSDEYIALEKENSAYQIKLDSWWAEIDRNRMKLISEKEA